MENDPLIIMLATTSDQTQLYYITEVSSEKQDELSIIRLPNLNKIIFHVSSRWPNFSR